MTLQGLPPPPFPVSFDASTNGRAEQPDGSWRIKTDSELLIDKLGRQKSIYTVVKCLYNRQERKLSKLRGNAQNETTPTSKQQRTSSISSEESAAEESEVKSNDEGLHLLSHAAPIAASTSSYDHHSRSASHSPPPLGNPGPLKARRSSSGSRIIELHMESSSDESGFHESDEETQRRPTNARPPTARQPSIQFNNVVRIHGGIRRPSQRSLRKSSSIRKLSSSSSPINLPIPGSPPGAQSCASSINPSLFSSRGSSPASSIYAPLTPANPFAPSPSRTLSLFANKTATPSRMSSNKHESYKHLIQQQQEEHQARKSSGKPEEERKWWSWFKRNGERDPLLPVHHQQPVKDELDVRFGTKPKRWFSSRYWRWKLHQVYLACCSGSGDDEEEEEG